jgi:hypothetical protein
MNFILQERIRIIALNMIEKQHKSVKSPSPDEYVTHPELSTVLLLLPQADIQLRTNTSGTKAIPNV